MSSEHLIRVGGRSVPLLVRRHPFARVTRLAVDARGLRLTVPPRKSVAAALRWAEGKGAWIEQALARLPARERLAPGGFVPIDGTERLIAWNAGTGRQVCLLPDRLELGGAVESIEPRLLRWMRAQACARLVAESEEIAAREGIALGRVSVGDPLSRWASCSSAGNLRYSWRLIMAPPDVRRAVVAHEVAHRLHMDHSPAFHAAVARLLGREPVTERKWLRENGARLHRIGG